MIGLWLLFGFVGLVMGPKYGYSQLVGFIAGALLGPFVLLMPFTAGGSKKCPFCASMVPREAIVCAKCQREQPRESVRPPENEGAGGRIVLGVMVGIIALVGIGFAVVLISNREPRPVEAAPMTAAFAEATAIPTAPPPAVPAPDPHAVEAEARRILEERSALTPTSYRSDAPKQIALAPVPASYPVTMKDGTVLDVEIPSARVLLFILSQGDGTRATVRTKDGRSISIARPEVDMERTREAMNR